MNLHLDLSLPCIPGPAMHFTRYLTGLHNLGEALYMSRNFRKSDMVRSSCTDQVAPPRSPQKLHTITTIDQSETTLAGRREQQGPSLYRLHGPVTQTANTYAMHQYQSVCDHQANTLSTDAVAGCLNRRVLHSDPVVQGLSIPQELLVGACVTF